MAASWKRTHTCGELRKEHDGQVVTLNGWVENVRDKGGFVFLVVRDRYGATQLALDPQESPEVAEVARELHREYCIAASGTVRPRPEGQANPDMATGEIEVGIHGLHIFNKAPTLPFQPEDHANVNEDLRLQYRFLDLRRPEAQETFFLRHKLAQTARRFLDEHGFLELETPVLTRSTPEGARDFLVPNRREAGTFYALPQSPQLFKQLLMVAGYDKYFQIVRCFRDEDLRADRQPEFTQIDMELSFVEEEDIFSIIEGLMTELHQAAKGTPLPGPYPRKTYEECLRTYGSDKPDTRFGLELQTLGEVVKDSDFKVFAGTVADGGEVVGVRLPGLAKEFSRKRCDQLNDLFKSWGGAGLAWLKWEGGKFSGSIAKFFADDKAEPLRAAMAMEEGDIAFFGAGAQPQIYHVMGILRLRLGEDLDLIDRTQNHVFWVTDFPLVEWNEGEKRWDALHHPFTAPYEEDLHLFDTDPAKIRSRGYDLVYNGYELAGGSIRIHDKKVQDKAFKLLGISEEEAQRRFPFLMRGLEFGAPPHGGIAWGFDRLVMVLGGIDNIKDVILFPKNNRGVCPMTEAPALVPEDQLDELFVAVKKPQQSS